MEKLTVLVLLVALSGCASIINGTTQKVPVTAEPSNATVVAVGGELVVNGTAPCTLVLKRKHPQVLTISAPGYKTQTVQLQSVLSGAVAGNILAGGLIGWGVDAASGADSKLVPESVNVVLEPDPAIVAQAGPTIEKTEALQADLKRLDDLLAAGSISKEEHASLRQKTIEQY